MRWSRSARRVVLGLCVAAMVAGVLPSAADESHPSLPPGAPTLAKNDFLFFPLGVFHDPVMKQAWYESIKRTRVALSNGYAVFEEQEREELQQGGTELFLYRWFNGYYAIEMLGLSYYSQFPEMIELFREINRHPEWLLNPGVPIAGNGAVTPAYFYDWMHPTFREFYIAKLVEHLDATGYDGVFFDYPGDYALPDPIRRLWALKHPTITYNEAGAVFIAELRQALGARRIFTNQSWFLDNAPDWWQHIDYDISESYGTSYAFGKTATIDVEGKGPTQVGETYYRPWDGGGGYKDYVENRKPHSPLDLLPGSGVEFFHTNYVHPWYRPTGQTNANGDPIYRPTPDRPAIYYGYALGKLHDLAAFGSDWPSWNGDPTNYVEDDVYRIDLGDPVDPSYVASSDALVRYFDNGFVVVTRNNSFNTQGQTNPGPTGSPDPVTVPLDPSRMPPGTAGLWDAYARASVTAWSGSSVVVAPDHYPATDSYYPSGRVYLYR